MRTVISASGHRGLDCRSDARIDKAFGQHQVFGKRGERQLPDPLVTDKRGRNMTLGAVKPKVVEMVKLIGLDRAVRIPQIRRQQASLKQQ